MDSQEIMRAEDGAMQEYSVQDVLAQVNKIQHIMREVMKDGEHFGVIPGCGKKPSLLKPGAEKLGFTFRLAPRFSGEREPIDLGRGHREYVIRCELYHIPSGTFVGSGVGSCSTMEAKYRYRTGPKEGTGQPVPSAYWSIRKTDPRKAQELIGGPGFSAAKIDGNWEIVVQGEKVEHDNPADHYNTVLKMGKKRAHVDAILTATAASDIFTQDIEEMAHEEADADPVPKVQMPQRKAPSAEPDAPPPLIDYNPGFGDAPPPEAQPSAPSSKPISEPQRKRLYAIAKGAGVSDADFKAHLEAMGYKSSSDVLRSDYDDICAHFEALKP